MNLRFHFLTSDKAVALLVDTITRTKCYISWPRMLSTAFWALMGLNNTGSHQNCSSALKKWHCTVRSLTDTSAIKHATRSRSSLASAYSCTSQEGWGGPDPFHLNSLSVDTTQSGWGEKNYVQIWDQYIHFKSVHIHKHAHQTSLAHLSPTLVASKTELKRILWSQVLWIKTAQITSIPAFLSFSPQPYAFYDFFHKFAASFIASNLSINQGLCSNKCPV